MNLFWDEEVPFISLFGGHHLFYILVMMSLLFLLVVNKNKVNEHAEKISRWILVISVLQQIILYSWYVLEMGFDVSESLPLHISRISSILGIVYLITKNNKILNVLFYFGLFAYGSFFWPQRVYPVYHIIGISFFINHAVTILLPIFGAIAYEWRPNFNAALQAYRWFLIYFTLVYFINPLIDGNYFYLKHRPFLGHLPDIIYVPFVLIGTLILFLLANFVVNWIRWRVIKNKS